MAETPVNFALVESMMKFLVPIITLFAMLILLLYVIILMLACGGLAIYTITYLLRLCFLSSPAQRIFRRIKGIFRRNRGSRGEDVEMARRPAVEEESENLLGGMVSEEKAGRYVE